LLSLDVLTAAAADDATDAVAAADDAADVAAAAF
jgi:hypothetical protein